MGKWKEQPIEGQDPRQEEGIPSPSVQFWSEGTPLSFFLQPGRKEASLGSYIGQTHTTVNKTHT